MGFVDLFWARGAAAGRVIALAVTGTALAALPAAAADRHAAFVIDANTGDVLRAEQADEPRYPASLTKMMTLYLAFEAIEAGRASYTTRIGISQEAASQAPTKLDLDPGETIQLIDAMKALITKSANDMAVAIGEHLAGSHGRFAELMTEKARRLGMSSTTFRNANGLPDPGQITTARDMVTLGLRLHDDFPTHYQLFAIKSFSYGRSSYRNHNNLLFNFQGTEGIKTGYTRASGFNLVASVRRGSRHVIGAIFGGTTASRRDDGMRLMLSHALIKASPLKTRKPAPVLVAQLRPAERPQPRPAPAPRPALEVAVAPEPRAKVADPVVADPVVAARRVGSAGDAPSNDARAPGQIVAVVPAANPAAPALPAVPPVEAARQSPVKIDVARVKPVMVPLRSRAEPTAAPTQVAQITPAKPASPPQSLPSLSIGFAPEPAAFAPARAPSPVPKTAAPAPGAAPSTLAQQAANLARGGPPVTQPPASQTAPHVQFAQAGSGPRFNLSGPQQAPQPASAQVAGIAPGGFEVQIGAYGSAAEAERALTSTRASAADLLAARTQRTVAVQKESRQFYRARFAGFDSKAAAATCLELRRRQIDCFVMKAE